MLSEPWRCDVTGNPVGTDTEMVGRPCQCQGCRASEKVARLERDLAAANGRAQTARREALEEVLSACRREMHNFRRSKRSREAEALEFFDWEIRALIDKEPQS